MSSLAFISMPGGWEMVIILVIGLLLFGRRLPEVGRSLGRSIVEFKKGVQGIEDEIDEAFKKDAKSLPDKQQRSELPAEKAPQVRAEERSVARDMDQPAPNPAPQAG